MLFFVIFPAYILAVVILVALLIWIGVKLTRLTKAIEEKNRADS